MATDYVMFIHGVSTRVTSVPPEYAKPLIKLVEQSFNLPFQPIQLYWGDVMEDPEKKLREQLQSPEWDQVWMKSFRENQIMQFAGDAVLYISRHVGYLAVQKLAAQIREKLGNANSNDRLHLVGHSLGGFILFDLFFSARWDENVPGHDDVQFIRNRIFGLSPNPSDGIRLVSMHTMGSPIVFFNLINIAGTDIQGGSTHNITPQLQDMLRNLGFGSNGRKLPWRNYIHPGDIIAYPLAKAMPSLVGGDNYIDIKDLIVRDDGFSTFFLPLSQTILAVLYGGSAHQTYWSSKKVAKTIAQTIQQVSS
ncbi:hypothetical protein GS682_29680 [Nostoc sp. B(2019)]|nr:hypothetical protein [Nostoc sp. B(2019)]